MFLVWSNQSNKIFNLIFHVHIKGWLAMKVLVLLYVTEWCVHVCQFACDAISFQYSCEATYTACVVLLLLTENWYIMFTSRPSDAVHGSIYVCGKLYCIPLLYLGVDVFSTSVQKINVISLWSKLCIIFTEVN